MFEAQRRDLLHCLTEDLTLHSNASWGGKWGNKREKIIRGRGQASWVRVLRGAHPERGKMTT